MRVFILSIFFSISLLASSGHTFLTDKYTKEVELEVKIISNIAKSIIKKDKIKIFIPFLKGNEKEIFKKHFMIAANCNSSDFIYFRNTSRDLNGCESSEKIYFTNSYKDLMRDKRFVGAFFWSKSRPNVIFLQHRLDSYNITLPKSYDKYIENF